MQAPYSGEGRRVSEYPSKLSFVEVMKQVLRDHHVELGALGNELSTVSLTVREAGDGPRQSRYGDGAGIRIDAESSDLKVVSACAGDEPPQHVARAATDIENPRGSIEIREDRPHMRAVHTAPARHQWVHEAKPPKRAAEVIRITGRIIHELAELGRALVKSHGACLPGG